MHKTSIHNYRHMRSRKNMNYYLKQTRYASYVPQRNTRSSSWWQQTVADLIPRPFSKIKSLPLRFVVAAFSWWLLYELAFNLFSWVYSGFYLGFDHAILPWDTMAFLRFLGVL